MALEEPPNTNQL